MQMTSRIFYSWQSDLPNSTNRGFIGNCLEKVAKRLKRGESIQIEPVIDRDTVGVPGAPDIARTIFSKIEQAQVFVCDVSIINQGNGFRLTPNPNVLVELGYALKALGENHIILIFNAAFGESTQLPFDLRMKRTIIYNLPESTKERTSTRKELETRLEQALRTIFDTIDKHYPNILCTYINEEAAVNFLKVLNDKDDTKRARENLREMRLIYEQILQECAQRLPEMKKDCSRRPGSIMILGSLPIKWLFEHGYINFIRKEFFFSIQRITTEFGSHPNQDNATIEAINAIIYQVKDMIHWFDDICTKYPRLMN